MKRIKIGAKIIIFIMVVAVLFVGANIILRPVWIVDDYQYSKVHGFYKEPNDTIETVFLGTSVMAHGVIPMELYEEYGICSYNLASQAQPMMASYYWLEETYRFHSKTLDTVVLDVSALKDDFKIQDQRYIKSFEDMKFSKVKYHFLKDFSSDSTEFFSYLIPVIAFHDRWKELSKQDFLEYKYELESYARGYGLTTDVAIDNYNTYMDISVPFYTLEDDTEIETYSEELLYFKKIVEFCSIQNINLVLIKLPQSGNDPWSDAAHNTAQSLANQYNLDFIDFNYSPYIDELNFNFATDSYDNIHLNFYGASKVTNWLGGYLTEECGNKDVRGDEKYAFLEEEAEDYLRDIIFLNLNEITDPAEYLSYFIDKKDYAIFISVKDDACDSLTEEQRERFKDLGLTELSQLPSHASYLSVIDDGEIVMEQMQAQDWEYIRSVEENQSGDQPLYITYRGKLSDKTDYYMSSGGYKMGNVSSIQIDGIEYSTNKRGLNIVVYDKKLKLVVDQARFDTYASPERNNPVDEETLEEAIESEGEESLSGKLLELYSYERMCDDTKTASILKQDTEKDNLTAYLQAFWDNEEFSIYMSGKGDISGALDVSERNALADMGLTDLSKAEKGDSYIAVVQEGEILTEQRGSDGEDIQANGEFYKVCSGETGGEKEYLFIIQGTEYIGETEGLNIVIYDNVLNQVIDLTVYTTDKLFVSNVNEGT